MVNFTSLADIVNATVYKTQPVFTGIGQGKLSSTETSLKGSYHYNDVIMGAIASQITSLTIVYLTVSDADQRKHQISASPAFVRGIHQDRWNPRTNGQLRGECFHLMTSSCRFGFSMKEICSFYEFTSSCTTTSTCNIWECEYCYRVRIPVLAYGYEYWHMVSSTKAFFPF